MNTNEHELILKEEVFAVVGCDIAGEKKQLTHLMGFFDTGSEYVLLAELIIAHTQAIAGLACVDCIRTVGIGITHMAQ